MSSEIELLAVMGNRTSYDRFATFIKDYVLTKESQTVLNTLGKWYKLEPTELVANWEKVRTYFMSTNKLKKDEVDIYNTIYEKLGEVELSSISASTEEILNHYIKLDYATRIADQAMRIAEGDKTLCLDDVLKNVTDYHKETKNATEPTDIFASTDLSILCPSVTTGGYEWRLPCLNRSLGLLRSGDFLIVAARPETGKTTFIASELTFIATQLSPSDGPIIWVNNEERSAKVQFRVIQAALGWTTDDIVADMPRAMVEYEKLMHGNRDIIKVLNKDKDNRINNIKFLDKLFNDTKPSVVVFDQLDKVQGFNKEAREDIRLGKLYEWARAWSEEFACIAVSQVNGSGEGQKWIFQDQLRGSTTDKSGEADAIVTIGRVNDPAYKDNRFIHVPKNKLVGGPMSVEADRHGYFEVLIDPTIARYKEVI